MLYCTSLQKETETVEFKENNSDKERIGRDVAALSNSANLAEERFAYLVFGARDTTYEIVGTDYSPKQEKVGAIELEFWLNQRINPKDVFSIHEFAYAGKQIVLFKISPAITKPVTFSGVSYIRIGSSATELKNHEEKESKIWTNVNKNSFEKNTAKENVSVSEIIDLLDHSAYFTLTKQEAPSQTNGFVEKMEQRGLVREIFTGKKRDILNLGAILFAKDLTNFESVRRKKVRIITYRGDTRYKREREYEEVLGYVSSFERLLHYIHDRLPVSEEITKSLRKERAMYLDVAIREFVANALIHQDLSISGTGPMVEIFDNRIEITNPGSPLIDAERLIDHPPRSRNESMSTFMRYIGICEESGTGIDRALTHIEMFQLPAPQFEAFPDATRVTLYAHRDLKDMSKEERIRACYQHCVLQYVERKRMTNASLRKRLGIDEKDYRTATAIINEAMKKEKIKISEKPKEYIPFWA